MVDAGYASRQSILVVHEKAIELVGPWVQIDGRGRQCFARVDATDAFLPDKFRCDAPPDTYICPEGQHLSARYGHDNARAKDGTLSDDPDGLNTILQSVHLRDSIRKEGGTADKFRSQGRGPATTVKICQNAKGDAPGYDHSSGIGFGRQGAPAEAPFWIPYRPKHKVAGR